jgi:TPR repeat protein
VSALERLVEVWAEGPDEIGRCGSGWVVGWRGVLTARHVVDPVLTASPRAGGASDTDRRIPRGVCLVRRVGATGFGDWVNCEVLWLHPTLDLTVLRVAPHDDQRWDPPQVTSPRLAGLGEQSLAGETVGFPDAEQKPSGERDTEHAVGRLLPLGGLRGPAALVPFDVDAAVPDDAALWRGISGSAVLDEHGRLIAVVVKVHPDRQQRRLFVVPIAHVARDPGFVRAARDVGLNPVVEDRFAPVWRCNVDCRALTQEGVPAAAAEVAEPEVFGVHTAVAEDIRGGPLPEYVPRQCDAELDLACDEAVAEGRRLVLVVGDSAAGKSRSAAEAVHRHLTLGARRLVVPLLDGGLNRLLDALSLDGTLVWLDDLDKHVARGLDTATCHRLLDHHDVVVVATIRARELLARGGDLRDPIWELLTDTHRVRRIDVDAALSGTELADARQRFSDRGLLDALDHGIGLGEWLVAGPRLEQKLLGATEPRRALVDTVVAWYRTGLKQPLPEDDLRRLWFANLDLDLRERLEQRPVPDRESLFRDACAWAREPLITRLLHEQALVTEQRDGYVANDYVVDRVVKRSDRPLVPAPVWQLATDVALESFIAGDEVRLWNVGVAAYGENAPDVAIRAMRACASADDPNAMFNLGVLLQQRGDPEALSEAETWYRRAAQHHDTDAMVGLGLLLEDQGTPDALTEAETWYRRAAQHHDTDAMVGLGLLLEDQGTPDALTEAETWYRRAAQHDHPDAMVNLGALLQQRGGPDQAEAETWYRRAAQHNDADAMYNLGALLQQRGGPDAAEAETWYRRAAQHDHPDAMVGLGLLLGGRIGQDPSAEHEPRHFQAPKHGHPERQPRGGHRAALTLALLGTAAAAILAAVLLVRPSPDSESVQLALTATELAPGAEGTADVTPEESGLRIELNATGLPRRDNGEFYQAWLRNDDGQTIPIGTFHDGNDVVLWAGVSLKDYPELTITQETADNNQASSENKVLGGSASSG